MIPNKTKIVVFNKAGMHILYISRPSLEYDVSTTLKIHELAFYRLRHILLHVYGVCSG